MALTGKRYEADKRLSGAVSHFYAISTSEDHQPGYHHLAPDLEMMIIFNFGNPVSFSFGKSATGKHVVEKIGIIGPLRQMMNYELGAGCRLLVVSFVYNGFYRLLSLPVDGLGREVLDESYISAYAHLLENLWTILAGIPAMDDRVTALADRLAADIRSSEPAATAVLNNMEGIDDPTLNAVKLIAGRTAVTERSVQSRVKKYTGYSLKELSRFLRFKQVLAYILAQPGKKIDWFSLIVDYGYHDQSHLIKDCKFYTGVTPSQFLQLKQKDELCSAKK